MTQRPRTASNAVRVTRHVATVAMLAAVTASSRAGSIDLAALDGPTGFVVHGSFSPDLTGASLGAAGDVNGDGLDDLIIGASGAGPNGFGSGRAYVLFGAAGRLPAVVETLFLDGTDGFAINGAASGDFAGVSVAAAGDVNGDGRDDVILGAWAADPNGASSGATYVVYGRDDPFPAAIELADLDGTDGFVINGVAQPDRSGISVAGAGDVNDDGRDDLIIGALNTSAHGLGTGTAYVVFGRDAGFPAAIELADLDGTDGFALVGVAAGDKTGVSVDGIGDLNGDGVDDVVVGASSAGADGIQSGAAYVLFGSAAPFPAAIELADLDGGNGFTCRGATNQATVGARVSRAGDVNADGRPDLVIGAPGADPGGAASGAAYVLYGRATAFPAVVALADLDGTDGFTIAGAAPGDRAGTDVAAAGDFDGDGVDDLLVGAREATPNGPQSGAAYVVFGRAGARPPQLALAGLGVTDGFALAGPLPGDQAGEGVATAGDLDGDGRTDLAVGAPGADPHGTMSGAAWVLYGDHADCNANGVIDLLDLACGTSVDEDGDGVPDECPRVCPGDLDGDLEVGLPDLLALLAAWGPCGRCDADLDDDGAVGFADLLLLLVSWGPCV